MKILSIDWDFFFPDSSVYDWGINEKNPVCYETIWNLRCSDINLINRKPMLLEYTPKIPNNFWTIVKNKPEIYISDSHVKIVELLEEDTYIVSIDAHHDCYLDSNYRNVNCANWAAIGINRGVIKEFHMVFPVWRKKENLTLDDIPVTSMAFELPPPADYDKVFVCRSSCWTPPWHDTIFKKFVFNSKLKRIFMDKAGWLLRKPKTLKEAMKFSGRLQNLLSTTNGLKLVS